MSKFGAPSKVRSTPLIGGVAAVLAAILLIVYLHSYRSSVNSGTRPMTVLVAKSLIPMTS